MRKMHGTILNKYKNILGKYKFQQMKKHNVALKNSKKNITKIKFSVVKVILQTILNKIEDEETTSTHHHPILDNFSTKNLWSKNYIVSLPYSAANISSPPTKN